MPGTDEERLTEEEQALLLRIARETIEAHLAGSTLPLLGFPGARTSSHRGAFVTLHKYGELRGCIGTFLAPKPLHETIREMAIASAMEDPRFPPLASHELPDVDIEISVLSPLREIRSPDEIVVGTHGLYITKGYQRGILLPQVATEYGWDRETFLDHTCLKAGLPSRTWREEKIRIEVFTAQVFGEKRREL